MNVLEKVSRLNQGIMQSRGVSALSRGCWGLELVVCMFPGSQFTETSGTHFELTLYVPCQY